MHLSCVFFFIVSTMGWVVLLCGFCCSRLHVGGWKGIELPILFPDALYHVSAGGFRYDSAEPGETWHQEPSLVLVSLVDLQGSYSKDGPLDLFSAFPSKKC